MIQLQQVRERECERERESERECGKKSGRECVCVYVGERDFYFDVNGRNHPSNTSISILPCNVISKQINANTFDTIYDVLIIYLIFIYLFRCL